MVRACLVPKIRIVKDFVAISLRKYLWIDRRHFEKVRKTTQTIEPKKEPIEILNPVDKKC